MAPQAGSPVQFPSVCPNCHSPAVRALRLERTFTIYDPSGDDTPNSTVHSIDAFDVPFCDSCIHRQFSQRTGHSPWLPLRRILSEANGFAGLVVLAISGLFFQAALQEWRIAPVLLGCLPLATAYWLISTTWRNSQHMAIPTPTAVESAIDFTPVLSLSYEPAWRAFQFRSPVYANLFREANRDRLWNPASPGARSSARLRERESTRTNLIVGAIVALVSILMALRCSFS